MRTTRWSPVIAILCAGLLAGSAVGLAAQDETDAPQLTTEEVEPGVERVISDGAGHDLDGTHPTHRYDMDRIAITADGTVWLTSTYHGSDNEANPGGSFTWALGQPGTHIQDGFGDLVILADGTLLANVGEASEALRFDGARFVPDDGPTLRQLADGGLLLSIDGADLAEQVPEGQAAPIHDLHAVWDAGWEGWTMLDERRDRSVWTGDHWCWIGENGGWGDGGWGDGVSCQRGWEDGSMTGAPTTYLADTFINQIAAAPDGSVWVVGGYGDGPGGLYRISLPHAG